MFQYLMIIGKKPELKYAKIQYNAKIRKIKLYDGNQNSDPKYITATSQRIKKLQR